MHESLLLTSAGTGSCDDGDVQLVGGKTEREGRVEICYNGVWGAVCADGWDEVNANVVCVQLGYGLPGEKPVHYLCKLLIKKI